MSYRHPVLTDRGTLQDLRRLLPGSQDQRASPSHRTRHAWRATSESQSQVDTDLALSLAIEEISAVHTIVQDRALAEALQDEEDAWSILVSPNIVLG